MNYKINEMFETIQGEGSFTGQPSIFIRLQGCPVGCSWCDTKHTWDVEQSDEIAIVDVLAKTQETSKWSASSEEQLLDTVKAQGWQAKHIVITGGEPCMYDLRPLCDTFENAGYSIQVETSGTFEVLVSDKCWVTVSPKINMKGGLEVLAQAIDRANEIKHPVATEHHVDELKALLNQFNANHKPVYLQPISQKQRATELAINTCIANNWRLSIQVHKYIGIE
ncbi:7-carboxy-7-deazaguanine synthase QueE [Thalassotalea agarivorans]|uniref:7-carboxy-7-deazaguanine synthase n=1 Tax=Thalassotalea agarivorans TaxID=349064 RepID=A0A1I0ENA2_THASX|nr:7-carboxy-7-deazaguanine synthase QueE [Thalassotalea agarivorans]SET46045.1 7-carboxy-7-deazaguanine synthase [Thalassotalea agarivorans]